MGAGKDGYDVNSMYAYESKKICIVHALEAAGVKEKALESNHILVSN